MAMVTLQTHSNKMRKARMRMKMKMMNKSLLHHELTTRPLNHEMNISFFHTFHY